MLRSKKRDRRQKEIERVVELISDVLVSNKLTLTTIEGVPIILWDCEENQGYALVKKEKK